MTEPATDPTRPPLFDGPLPEWIAAVDLGSNSFHMVVARLVQGVPQVVDRLRDRVALASGLDAELLLDEASQERALACLERFGQRLRELPARGVRAVGTSTFRRARNAREFLERAGPVLGAPIDVISGREEARLIYQGVVHSDEETEGLRLVVDIGGGSSECILGEGYGPILTDSLHMGCVNFTERFFPAGVVTRKVMDRAKLAARREVQTIELTYQGLGWETCTGASGTILAVESIVRENGWSDGGITEKGLKRLVKALVEAGHVEKLALPGLQAERAPVLPGGVAILAAFFEGLQIERMHASSGALREGILFDLIGRIRHDDVRDHTIRRMSERYHVDLRQAARVERTALHCFRSVAGPWSLDREYGKRMLSWASRLHEIGISIAHSGYHKHGAYILSNCDLPGFSSQDQTMLAALVLGHRRRFSPARIAELVPDRADLALRLCIPLRIATVLNRARSSRPVPSFHVEVDGTSLELVFPQDWLAERPLTQADLEAEAQLLQAEGWDLKAR